MTRSLGGTLRELDLSVISMGLRNQYASQAIHSLWCLSGLERLRLNVSGVGLSVSGYMELAHLVQSPRMRHVDLGLAHNACRPLGLTVLWAALADDGPRGRTGSRPLQTLVLDLSGCLPTDSTGRAVRDGLRCLRWPSERFSLLMRHCPPTAVLEAVTGLIPLCGTGWPPGPVSREFDLDISGDVCCGVQGSDDTNTGFGLGGDALADALRRGSHEAMGNPCPRVWRLALRQRGLGPVGCSHLDNWLRALRPLPRSLDLILDDNPIGDLGVQALLNGLYVWGSSLRRLSLSLARTQMTNDAVETLCLKLQNGPWFYLQGLQLDLRGNRDIAIPSLLGHHLPGLRVELPPVVTLSVQYDSQYP